VGRAIRPSAGCTSGELMGETEPSALLARLDELHDRVTDILDRLADTTGSGRAGDDPSTDESGGTWSVTDVLAHIGRWDELSRSDLGAHLSGAPIPEQPKYRVLNAEWVGKDVELSLAEARTRYKAAYAGLRQLLVEAEPERWDGTVHDYVDTTIEHYKDHVRAPLEFEVAPGG